MQSSVDPSKITMALSVENDFWFARAEEVNAERRRGNREYNIVATGTVRQAIKNPSYEWKPGLK